MNRNPYLFCKILTAILLIFLSSPLSAEIGDVLYFFDSPLANPAGIAYDGEFFWATNIVGSNDFTLNKIDDTGNILFSATPFRFLIDKTSSLSPEGMIYDGRYLLIILNDPADSYDVIYKYDTSFKSNFIISLTSPVNNPTSLAFDGEFFWTTDVEEPNFFSLNKFDKSGDIIYSRSFVFSSGNSSSVYPVGMAYDGEFFWLAINDDSDLFDKIYKLDSDLNVIDSFFSPGYYLTGITFDGTYLWIVDKISDTDSGYRIFKIDAGYDDSSVDNDDSGSYCGSCDINGDGLVDSWDADVNHLITSWIDQCLSAGEVTGK